jgi:hypothetical protein
MKLIITESQKDKLIEKFVFDYLKKQDYKLVDTNNRIYFVKNIGDEYADIRFDKEYSWCIISRDLVSFLSMMLSTEHSDIQNVIGKYVENTLQMKVTSNIGGYLPTRGWLRIPYK